jgi:hypothetical protein
MPNLLSYVIAYFVLTSGRGENRDYGEGKNGRMTGAEESKAIPEEAFAT